MAETSVLLSIGDMIDLAIGTPEIGVVDFNMLQTLLHCLAQQLRILGKSVELRGSVAALPVGRENAQTVTVQEFVYDSDAGKKEMTLAPPPVEPEQTLLVVERVRKSDSPEPKTPGASRSPTPHEPPPPKTGTASKSIHAVPSRVPSVGPERLSLVTLSKFNLLEGVVEDLKNRVYGSMPKNEEILEEVRSQTNLKAITDMWTSLNVSSRLEAAETGMDKLSSLVQDLIGEMNKLQKQANDTSAAISTIPTSKPAAAPAPAPAPTAPAPVPAPVATAPSTTQPPAQAKSTIAPAPLEFSGLPAATVEDLNMIQDMLERLRADLDQLTEMFYATIEEIQAEIAQQGQAPAQVIEVLKMVAPAPSAAAPAPAPAPQAQPQVIVVEKQSPPAAAPKTEDKPKPAPSTIRRPAIEPSGRRLSTMTAGIQEKIIHLEKEMKKCCDKIAKTEGHVQDQLNSFQDQLEYVSRQVGGVSQELGSGKLSPDLIKDLQGLMQLFQTVQEIQEQLKDVHGTALQLAAEKEDRQHHINALLEQIELLKTIKLDREDMAEALADKADMRMLARKVSHDQFEMACDDLSRGLEHAIGKLSMQEALWQQALDDIQREIESKLDKVELSPVKDFFNSKLKLLQDNLKQMASLRREAEAAGTKRRLLRDVNCISCDANAMMAMDAPPCLPVNKPLPATLSMKPYLSYELDAIRKSHASNLPQRNMHDWETIDKQAKQPHKARSETDKHICNRYCGGSHTVTTAAQRVARLGHFIKQWGPDVLPLSSGLAAGDDGRMYKVSPADGVPAGPGSKCEPLNPLPFHKPGLWPKSSVCYPCVTESYVQQQTDAGGVVDATCTAKPPFKKPEPKPPKPMVISAECHCLDSDAPAKG